ncbi:MAG: 4-carboxy-4-hydroxy-2-oxoadipate aldolase/oxaloacetate decarboxylase [Spirochaetota bacterium]|nr:MAG: 4-carboxy-4-hydroxy-2-oxoadipate aldolase/oxaloacetate decarboxylase [Spirochaetota bacterium]
MIIHTIKEIRRPEKDLIEQFSKLSSATVYEASGKQGYINSAIKPIDKEMKVCGPAFTVQCAPRDNLMLHKALQIANAGDILVVDAGDAHEYGYWGALMVESAISRGIGGLVINGCIRDSLEIIEMNFPVFCLGFSIRGTTKASLGLINYSLVFSQTITNPGDLILGDNDGLVVVRYEDCKSVLNKALERVSVEEEKKKKLSMGVSSVELNKMEDVFKNLGYKEQ